MTSKYWYGKTAVVTGASSGIGASVALKLANAGITVIGLARRVELIEELNNQITGEGKIHAYCCDLSDESNILEAFRWIQEKFTTFQILICNAGMVKANFLSESPSADVKQLYDLNIFATTICLREGLRIMRSTPNLKYHIIIMNR
uniref:Dehydrogenase/reductase SDR family member 11 n=1 Tax=Glossina brevipalpis TaxID=37001 RepID=A0A1A9W2U3_9MUSC